MDDDFEGGSEAALVTRWVLEQAKGILGMARGATPEEAYAELRHVSQQRHITLNRLAEAVVETTWGRECDDPLLRKVLWQEWGNLFHDQDCDPV